jgi:hypothetical protein
MNAIHLPQLPAHRLALALALSVLLHILLLWLPSITLLHHRAPVPFLTVRLEAPLKASQQATQQKPPPHPSSQKPVAVQPPQAAHTPKPPSPSVAPAPGTTQAMLSEAKPHKIFTAPNITVPASAAAGQSLPLMAKIPYDEDHTPALPLHAQLRFAVYLNDSNISIGDMFQELDITGNQYILQSELAKAGMGSLVSRYEIKQSSRGTLSDTGTLLPDEFTEDSTGTDGTHHSISATFHWADHQLSYANGTSTSLPDGTQDMLSFMYQLSRFSFNTEIIPLTITDGNSLESMRLEVSTYENIDTPMGELLTMHLRKMHLPGEPWMEVWLGVDYDLLPVKFRKVDADGRVREEMDIREIRSSDIQ